MKLFKTEKQISVGSWTHWILTIVVSALAFAASATLFSGYEAYITFIVGVLGLVSNAIGRQLPNDQNEKFPKVTSEEIEGRDEK